MMLKGLIAFFVMGFLWSVYKRDLPMVLYFAGAALLNFGVLIK
jgi:hypothetical protein